MGDFKVTFWSGGAPRMNAAEGSSESMDLTSKDYAAYQTAP